MQIKRFIRSEILEEYTDEKLKPISQKVKAVVDNKAKYNDWSKRNDIKAEQKVELIIFPMNMNLTYGEYTFCKINNILNMFSLYEICLNYV